MSEKEMLRRGVILRRLLVTFDIMTDRRPMTIAEITNEINSRTGETFCTRTIRRDLAAGLEVGVFRVAGGKWGLDWTSKKCGVPNDSYAVG